MRVAGIGFRAAAPVSALRAALAAAGGAVDALASAEDKAAAPQARELARALGLPLLPIPTEALARQQTLTHSPRVAARYGTGSLAEAAALAGAGPGARLIGPRVTSPCGRATAAIAESDPS